MYKGEETHNKKRNYTKKYIKICYKGEKPMIKNVIVTDEFGNKQGLTYPKRAKGLIKQGRAEFVGENKIRLFYKQNNLLSSLINMEDDIMSEFDNFDNKENSEKTVNKLYFNAREWSFNPDCATNKGERTFVTDFEDNLIESYTVGDNSANTTEIMTKQLVLKKNTEYVFTFWIKQTSFKKFDTTCQLQILYNIYIQIFFDVRHNIQGCKGGLTFSLCIKW